MSEYTTPWLARTIAGKIVEPFKALMNGGSSIACMDELHAEIHKGGLFAGGKLKTALAASAKFYLVGHNIHTTGDELHIPIVQVTASNDVIVRTLGGVTGQVGGTLSPSYNRKGGAVDTNSEVFWDATSLTGTTVAIKEIFIPGGSGPFALGGSGGFLAERIIADGGWVALEIENASGTSAVDFLSVEWDFYYQEMSG